MPTIIYSPTSWSTCSSGRPDFKLPDDDEEGDDYEG